MYELQKNFIGYIGIYYKHIKNKLRPFIYSKKNNTID